VCLGSKERFGSITIVGAVSPPGGDFSEPITQNTLRIAGTFWALDTSLAYRRHFPSVNWIKSYSLYLDSIEDWFMESGFNDWKEMRDVTMYLLQKEVELQEIVQLVGPDALPESEKAILEVTRMIREDFLQQSAYHEIDSFCPLDKQYWMLKVILNFYERTGEAMNKGVALNKILKLPLKAEIGRMKELREVDEVRSLIGQIDKKIAAVEVER
jgi:V/A-type H+-transporting ATPase subunit A